MERIYSHREEVSQFTIFACRVNHILHKAWHWRGGICFTFLHWQPKHPHSVGVMEHIFLFLLAQGDPSKRQNEGNHPYVI